MSVDATVGSAGTRDTAVDDGEFQRFPELGAASGTMYGGRASVHHCHSCAKPVRILIHYV